MKKIFFISISFFAFLSFFFFNQLNIPPDTENFYLPVAKNIASGNGYTLNGQFSFRYPPFFPVFLAAIFSCVKPLSLAYFTYRLLIIVLQAFSCVFLYKIGKKVSNDKFGLQASFLYMIYPFALILTVTNYAWNHATLFTFLFLGFVYFYIKSLSENKLFFIMFAGLFLALSALTWPASFYFFVPAIIYLFIHWKSVKKVPRFFIFAGVFIVSFLPSILIWQGFIYNNTKDLRLISNAKDIAVIEGLRRHEGSKFDRFPIVQKARSLEEKGYLKKSEDVMNLYIDEFINNPLATLKFVVYKASRAFYATDSEKHENLILLLQLPYFILGSIGLVLSFRRAIYYRGFLLMIIGYFWLVAFSVLSILRYMVPVMALWMIFVAIGAEAVFSKVLRQFKP